MKHGFSQIRGEGFNIQDSKNSILYPASVFIRVNPCVSVANYLMTIKT
jgi:hypothetical protein